MDNEKAVEGRQTEAQSGYCLNRKPKGCTFGRANWVTFTIHFKLKDFHLKKSQWLWKINLIMISSSGLDYYSRRAVWDLLLVLHTYIFMTILTFYCLKFASCMQQIVIEPVIKF